VPHEFRVTRQVEFSETDAAGIVHFSNFFRYMEAAEHAFFRSLGESIHHDGATVGWPRVHASCDYVYPLRFEDTVEIRLLVREVRARSIVYDVRFWKLNGEPREVARGTLKVASVTRDSDGRLRSVALPADLAAKIESAPQELLKR
jgi:YbgC/YbaW family acyl-CoA thioester hydrolase